MLVQTLGILVFSCALAVGTARAADVVEKGKVARTPEGLVPAGWKVRAKAEGDLNGDGRADVALALERNEPVKEEESTGNNVDDDDIGPRFLLVAIRTAGAYRVVSTSGTAVLCKQCGGFGDPVNNISIKKGVMVIAHYGGSAAKWWYVDRYRFHNGDFRRIGALHGSRSADGDEYVVDTNLLNGAQITTIHCGTDRDDVAVACHDKVKKGHVPKKPLVSISEVGPVE